MIKKFYSLIFVSGVLLFASSAVADLEIEFEVIHTTVDQADLAKRERNVREYVPVRLGKGYILIDQGGIRTIYDIRNRLIYTLDLGNLDMQKKSLYTVPAYRSIEFMNRIFAGTMMRQMNRKQRDVQVMLSEHEYSINHPTQKRKLKPRKFRDYALFSANRRMELMEIGTEGIEIPSNLLERYVSMLRYWQGGHPEGYEWVLKNGLLPNEIVLYKYLYEREQTTIKVKSWQEVEDEPYSLTGFVAKGPKSHQRTFTDLLDRISIAWETASDDLLRLRSQNNAENRREAEQAFVRRRPLQGILGMYEFSLQTGENFEELLKPYEKAIAGDPQVEKLLGVLTPKSELEAENSIEVIESLIEDAGPKRYMLNLFLARNKKLLRQTKEAYDAYRAVIESSPGMAGIYKEVGDFFYQDNNIELAWRCWNIGRSILPDSDMFDEVKELEKGLETTFPHYFYNR